MVSKMPKSNETEFEESTEQPRAKQPYNPPVLSRYGAVKDLTTSGSELGMEGDDMGMGKGKDVAKRD